MKRKYPRNEVPPPVLDLWTEREWEDQDAEDGVAIKRLVLEGGPAERVIRLAVPDIDGRLVAGKSHVSIVRTRWRAEHHRFAVVANRLFLPGAPGTDADGYSPWFCALYACREVNWRAMIGRIVQAAVAATSAGL